MAKPPSARAVGIRRTGVAALSAILVAVVGPASGMAVAAATPPVVDSSSVSPGVVKQAIRTVPIADEPRAVRVTPDQRFAYIPAAADHVVSIVDLRTGLVNNLPVGRTPMDLAFNRSGSTAYVPNESDGTVSVIDVQRQTVIRTLPVGGSPTGIAVVSTRGGGERLFVADFGGSLLSLVDPTTGATTRSWNVAQPAGVVGTADGKVVVPSSDDGTVLLIDVDTLATTTLTRPDQGPTNPASIAVYRNTVVLPGDSTTWLDTTDNAFSGELDAIAPGVTSGSALIRGGAYTLLTTRDFFGSVPRTPGVLSLVRNSDHTTVATLQVGIGPTAVTLSSRGVLVVQGPAVNGQFDLLIVPTPLLVRS